MKSLADAYFNLGWIVISVLGVPLGWYAGKRRNWTMLAGGMIACGIIGLAAFVGRYL